MARGKPKKCSHGWLVKNHRRSKKTGRYCRPRACKKFGPRKSPLLRKYKSGKKVGQSYYSYCRLRKKRN